MPIKKLPIIYSGGSFHFCIVLTFSLLCFASCQSWGKFWEIEEPDICQRSLSYSQIAEAQYSDLLLKYLRMQRDKGSSGPATTQYTMTGLTTTAYKWLGGVLAPNGQIYAMPFAGSLMALIINPVTGTTSFSAATSGTGERAAGGVLSHNGKIYGIPTTANPSPVIDPANNSLSYFSFPVATNQSWLGGAMAPNGKIYAVP